jgi:Mrp family chromosome partitioning ATPase
MPSADAVGGVAALFENLRVLATRRATRTVVFAGASVGTGVDLVATALASHAARSGSRVFVAELAGRGGRSLLAPFATASNPDANVPGLAVDLDAGLSADQLHAWIGRAAPSVDLVVLIGPPLASSIDAALLAGACDGLVIVAESEKTERVALQTAAERARATGCRTLGVVMHGTKDQLPRWMRRLMGTEGAPSLS